MPNPTRILLTLPLLLGLTACGDDGSDPSAGSNDAYSYCGDDRCDGDESRESCPHDCSVCGDGICEGAETASGCAVDCCSSDDLCGSTCLSGTQTCCPDDAHFCADGTCQPDSTRASGFACSCDAGEKWCDHSCIPSTADCCDSGVCGPDASAASGYSCHEPTGVCLYWQSMSTSCGSSDPGSWHCATGSWTLARCRSVYDGDATCVGSCCWRYYDTRHQIYAGSCSEALATKN